MRVYLTGGTGLIGSHVAERLRGDGHEVVALVRPRSAREHLRSIGCRLVEGDVLDAPAELARGMSGADAVVHAAAKVFERGRRREFERSNVEGTTGVLEAAAMAAPRVVHVSSVAVYAGLPWSAALTEDRWRQADPKRQRAYAASKTVSERLAWGLHGDGVIRLTTVRPAVVYGERDRAAAPILLRYAGLPVVPLLSGGRSPLPLVYAGNVARGIVAALERPVAVGRAYNLAQDDPVTARDVVETVRGLRGRRARVVRVPAAPVSLLAAAVDRVAGWTPVPVVDLRRAVRSLTMPNPYDSDRARLELGWTDLVPHREGMRRTLEWWQTMEGSNAGG
jgi:2-alkyl-3-oxoalkanoate reductase